MRRSAALLALHLQYNSVTVTPKADLHRIALRAYSMDSIGGCPGIYRRMNDALCKDGEAGLKEWWGSTIALIRRAIRENPLRLDRSRCMMTVWRGMSVSAELTEIYKQKGMQFLWASVVSATRSEAVARQFGNLLFRIRCNENGTGATYALDIQADSQFPDEQEVILYPYSGYEVIGFCTQGGVTIVDLKTVDTLMIEAMIQSKKTHESESVAKAKNKDAAEANADANFSYHFRVIFGLIGFYIVYRPLLCIFRVARGVRQPALIACCFMNANEPLVRWVWIFNVRWLGTAGHAVGALKVTQ